MLLRRRISVSALLTTLVLVGGCGKETHESLMQENIDQMKQMVDTMKKIKDKNSALAQVDTFKSIDSKLKNIKERSDKLPKLSAEQEKALEEKFKSQTDPLMQEMLAEGFRIMSLGPEVQTALQNAMSSFGQH